MANGVTHIEKNVWPKGGDYMIVQTQPVIHYGSPAVVSQGAFIAARFLADIKGKMGATSWRCYQRNLNRLLEKLDGQDIATIDEDALLAAVRAAYAHEKRTTVKAWRATVKQFFAFCVELGVRPDNPADIIKINQPQALCGTMLQESPEQWALRHNKHAGDAPGLDECREAAESLLSGLIHASTLADQRRRAILLLT